MSHWAEIDDTGLVLRVLVGDNNESDEGKSFMESLGGTWVKTSFNGNVRKNFAGIGYTYMGALDAFVAPKCHDEATLNLENCRWECSNNDHEVPTI
jgi:hypothetical protein